MVAGIVDENHEVVAPGLEPEPDAPEQAQVGRQLPQRLDEPHYGELLHAVEHGGARGLEVGAAERLDGGPGKTALQRGHDRGGVRVPRRLARGDVDAGRAAHGRVAAKGAGGAGGASGDAWMAAVTRKARAKAWAPAAPDTTTSSSPRTARRKLSSSSLSGSASGASSRTCSTICSSV